MATRSDLACSPGSPSRRAFDRRISDLESADDVVVADLDLIREVRNTWQFFRDRRPETYEALVRL